METIIQHAGWIWIGLSIGLLIGFLGWFFGRATTIGGPEHRDPTDQELKDAKERYGSKYLNRPNDSLPPVYNTVDDE